LPASWNGLGEDWSTTMGWYPANSWRWAGAGTIGNLTLAYYWTATTVSGSIGQAYYLYFNSNNALELLPFAKGDSFAVRCVKE